MINESDRARGAHASCIRALYLYGRELAARAGEEAVCDFSLGNPSEPPPERVRDALADLVAHAPPKRLHGYTVAAGSEEARDAIAQDLNRRFAAGAGAADLFLTAGAAPALTAVLAALTVSPASEFAALCPCFPEYEVFAGVAGGRFVSVPAAPDFSLNLDGIAAALTPHTQAVILNSPNNPSGRVYDNESLHRLAALLTDASERFGHPVYLISDEPYRELLYTDAPYPWVPHCYPDTVVCYSYSKSLSLPGDRIGYVLIPPTVTDGKRLMQAVAGAARRMGHVCAPALLQHLIARVADVLPCLDTYRANRDLLYRSLTGMGYRCVPPDGAFYLFVRAPGGDGAAFSERMKQAGVLVVPGADFGCPDYVRIAYCVEPEVIRRALPHFRTAIEEIAETE